MASTQGGPSANPPTQSLIFVLVPDCDNSFYCMHKLVVVREDTDIMVLSRIRALAPQRSMTRPGVSQWLKRILAMRRLAIGTAQVLGLILIETQIVPAQHVHKIKENEPLTKLMNNASVPLPSPGHLKAYLINETQHHRDEHVQIWCLHYKLDGAAASMWLLLALVISLGIGLAVGFSCGDGKLGLDVGTCVIAVLSAIQTMIIMWGWRVGQTAG